MSVKIAEGRLIPTGPRGFASPLTTNRSTSYRFDLLDVAGQKFGELDGVVSGSIEWNANSQVKGGGKLVVSKANAAHDKEIRVVVNRPVLGESDFETDMDGYAPNSEFTDYMAAPAVLERSTDVFYEGAASLHYGFSNPVKPGDHQSAVRQYNGLVPGERYTFVARVLNTAVDDAIAKVVFNRYVPLPIRGDWQVVAIQFTALREDAWFGIENRDPRDGQHIYLDSVVLYEGETNGYNGETFRYAPFEWTHARIRPVMMIDGVPEQPLGVFVPSAPVEQWDEGGGRQELELLDRTSIIAQDYMPSSYTVKKGTKVVSAVRRIIASTGESPGTLPKLDDTLTSDMTWGAGSNKLTVINDLLDAAGFFALWADAQGQFRIEKYRSPERRPVTFELLDGEGSIYLPTLSIDRDIYKIPNRVIMTAQGDGESEGWTSVATNRNPKSPFSFQRRGRWITDVQLGIEANSKEALDKKAQRRLASLTSAQTSVQIQHAPVPGLSVNDVVRLIRSPANVDSLFAVTKTEVNFDPTALSRTTLTEVVEL